MSSSVPVVVLRVEYIRSRISRTLHWVHFVIRLKKMGFNFNVMFSCLLSIYYSGDHSIPIPFSNLIAV